MVLNGIQTILQSCRHESTLWLWAALRSGTSPNHRVSRSTKNGEATRVRVATPASTDPTKRSGCARKSANISRSERRSRMKVGRTILVRSIPMRTWDSRWVMTLPCMLRESTETQRGRLVTERVKSGLSGWWRCHACWVSPLKHVGGVWSRRG